jgi:hypothetical protein
MKNRTSMSRKIGVESLERRQLMAGDVFAALEGSLLTVQGDSLDNQITMTRTTTGDIVIAGQNGTLVNGLPSVRFPRVQLNALEVRMEDGSDTVALRGLQVANDLFVELGTGNDRLIATRVQAAEDAVIEGGAGIDTLENFGISAGIKREFKEFEVIL